MRPSDEPLEQSWPKLTLLERSENALSGAKSSSPLDCTSPTSDDRPIKLDDLDTLSIELQPRFEGKYVSLTPSPPSSPVEDLPPSPPSTSPSIPRQLPSNVRARSPDVLSLNHLYRSQVLSSPLSSPLMSTKQRISALSNKTINRPSDLGHVTIPKTVSPSVPLLGSCRKSNQRALCQSKMMPSMTSSMMSSSLNNESQSISYTTFKPPPSVTWRRQEELKSCQVKGNLTSSPVVSMSTTFPNFEMSIKAAHVKANSKSTARKLAIEMRKSCLSPNVPFASNSVLALEKLRSSQLLEDNG
ncbi:hypothetical protein P9112_000555 [Eukaryota sp. TZLM1-RC]